MIFFTEENVPGQAEEESIDGVPHLATYRAGERQCEFYLLGESLDFYDSMIRLVQYELYGPFCLSFILVNIAIPSQIQKIKQ